MHRVLTPGSGRMLQTLFRQAQNQIRHRSRLPINTAILFVPQQEAWIIERFGKYDRLLEPGINFLIPIVDSIKYVQSLKEVAIDVPQQSAITLDNVNLQMDAVLYLRVVNPYRASYGVEDPEYAITQLAQTTMRSEIGKIQMDTLFRERESLNTNIVGDIKLPSRIQEAMQMQVEAERKKRAAILESEGIREGEINVAEGKKQARILNSEADKTEQINEAAGDAQAILARANAKASAIDKVAGALSQENALNAVCMHVAEQYVDAFSNLAKQNNTVILPANVGDISSMVAQVVAFVITALYIAALTIYSRLSKEISQVEDVTNAVKTSSTKALESNTTNKSGGKPM